LTFPDFTEAKPEGFNFPPNAKEISDLVNSGQGVISQTKKKIEDSGLEQSSKEVRDSLGGSFSKIDNEVQKQVDSLSLRNKEKEVVKQILSDSVNKGLGDVGKKKNKIEGSTRSASDFTDGNISHPFQETEFSKRGTKSKPIKGAKGYSQHVEKRASEIMQSGKTKSKVDESKNGNTVSASSCSTFNDILGIVFCVLDDVLYGVSESINNVINAVGDKFNQVFNTVGEALNQVATSISNAIEPLVSGVNSALNSAFSSIQSVATDIVNSVEDLIGDGIEALGNAGDSLFDAISNLDIDLSLPAGEGGIAEALGTVGSNIASTLDSVATSIGNAVGPIIDSVSNAVDTALDGVESLIDDLGQGFKDVVTAINEEIENLSEVLGEIGEFIPSISLPELFNDPCAGPSLESSGSEDLRSELQKAQSQDLPSVAASGNVP